MPFSVSTRVAIAALVFACLSFTENAHAAEYRFYHPDPLGSNIVVTDRSGAVVQRMVITPFGEPQAIINASGQSIEPSASSSRHLFLGEEHDPESGLHQLNARYYDPFVGRFLAVDPELLNLGLSFQGVRRHPELLNNYAYALNRPTVLLDPSGAHPTEPAPEPTPDRARHFAEQEDGGGVESPLIDPIDLINPQQVGTGLVAGVIGKKTVGSFTRKMTRALGAILQNKKGARRALGRLGSLTPIRDQLGKRVKTFQLDLGQVLGDVVGTLDTQLTSRGTRLVGSIEQLNPPTPQAGRAYFDKILAKKVRESRAVEVDIAVVTSPPEVQALLTGSVGTRFDVFVESPDSAVIVLRR